MNILKSRGRALLVTVTCFVLAAAFPGVAVATNGTGQSDSEKIGYSTYYRTISGADRYETAYTFSRNQFSDSLEGYPDGVIITTGENYPDALAIAGLAGHLNYAVMLTSSDKLDDHTVELLAWHSPKIVIIVGGEGAVSTAVQDGIAPLDSVQTVVRLGGADRYETAQRVYEYGASHNGGWGDENAVVVSGDNFPDAVSISSYAAYAKAPVFLADGSGELDAFSKDEVGVYQNVYIAGGSDVVSEATERFIQDDTTRDDRTVKRFGGSNRYGTNQQIMAYFCAQSSGVGSYAAFTDNEVYITTGSNFPDALIAGISCGLDKTSQCPSLLLVDESRDGLSFIAYLKNEDRIIQEVTFIGGDTVITPTTRYAVMYSINGEPVRGNG